MFIYSFVHSFIHVFLFVHSISHSFNHAHSFNHSYRSLIHPGSRQILRGTAVAGVAEQATAVESRDDSAGVARGTTHQLWLSHEVKQARRTFLQWSHAVSDISLHTRQVQRGIHRPQLSRQLQVNLYCDLWPRKIGNNNNNKLTVQLTISQAQDRETVSLLLLFSIFKIWNSTTLGLSGKRPRV